MSASHSREPRVAKDVIEHLTAIVTAVFVLLAIASKISPEYNFCVQVLREFL